MENFNCFVTFSEFSFIYSFGKNQITMGNMLEKIHVSV